MVTFVAVLPGDLTAQEDDDKDVPYVPTPYLVVEKMLNMADVKQGDYVIDLGSGDGRIVIAAAQRGAAGHGVDIDPKRVREARRNAKNTRVDHRVMFKQGDVFKSEFSEASVITIYLLPEVNRKLRPTLINQLEPGTRIVSHDFDMGTWNPDRQATVKHQTLDDSHSVYLWIVPAQVEGRWSWKIRNRRFNATINQTFQNLEASVKDDEGTRYSVKSIRLRGKRIEMDISDGQTRYLLNGRIDGSQIDGSVQIHQSDQKKSQLHWTATKIEQ